MGAPLTARPFFHLFVRVIKFPVETATKITQGRNGNKSSCDKYSPTKFCQ